MMTDLPEPILPSFVDLRDFTFMPVDIVRLFGSEFHANATDAEWRAGVTLWLKSYHQVPAASLPADDVALARLAELGRDIKSWRKIKAGALRGWVKCSDGRLHHEVVAEKAAEGWNAKQIHHWKKECDRLRKENKQRVEKGEIALPLPAKPADLAKTSSSKGVTFRQASASIPPECDPPSIGNPPTVPQLSDGIPLENALKGQGQGQGQGQSIAASQQGGAARAKRLEPHDDGPAAHSEALQACIRALGSSQVADPMFGPIMLLVEDGIPLAKIITVMRSEAEGRRSRSKPPIKFWSKWAEIIVERLDAAPKVAPRPPPPGNPTDPVVILPGGVKRNESWIRQQLERWEATRHWPDVLGSPPGKPGCHVPKHLLSEPTAA